MIGECARFPMDKHDDYVDCVTMAVEIARLGYMLDSERDEAPDWLKNWTQEEAIKRPKVQSKIQSTYFNMARETRPH